MVISPYFSRKAFNLNDILFCGRSYVEKSNFCNSHMMDRHWKFSCLSQVFQLKRNLMRSYTAFKLFWHDW